MIANNETGVIQPVAEAADLAREHGLSLHVDAVQGPGRLLVDFATLGADTLVISGHKLGGPRGVGALIVRDGVNLPALIKGGAQERRRRGGTENVAGIAGFGVAAAEAARSVDAAGRMAALRDKLESGVTAATPNAVIIGRNAPRIANTSCIAVPGKPAETLVIRLDLAGIAVSAGAACTSGKVGANSVLEAMGLGGDIARSSVRVSLGPETNDDDIAAFLAAWEKIAGRAALAA
jgi:cysteine desulfurase